MIERDNKLSLDRQHAYYQFQVQIFICEVNFCAFVLWTKCDVDIECILPGQAIPNIMSNELTTNSEEGQWYYCEEDIEGSELIGCDNSDCKIM